MLNTIFVLYPVKPPPRFTPHYELTTEDKLALARATIANLERDIARMSDPKHDQECGA